jgi:hypothetical protein
MINMISVAVLHRFLFSSPNVLHITLGGQAHVPDIEGVWFELVRNVSYFIFSRFCSNLTWAILGKSDGGFMIIAATRTHIF